MPREVLNPDTHFNSLQYGFSQIAMGQGNRIVTISGQVAWDAQGNLPPDADLRQQAFIAFDNLALALKAAGGSFDDVLLLHIYIVESAMGDTMGIRDGLKHFFPDKPPATSWIGVPRLANEGFLVEIEAIAVMP